MSYRWKKENYGNNPGFHLYVEPDPKKSPPRYKGISKKIFLSKSVYGYSKLVTDEGKTVRSVSLEENPENAAVYDEIQKYQIIGGDYMFSKVDDMFQDFKVEKRPESRDAIDKQSVCCVSGKAPNRTIKFRVKSPMTDLEIEEYRTKQKKEPSNAYTKWVDGLTKKEIDPSTVKFGSKLSVEFNYGTIAFSPSLDEKYSFPATAWRVTVWDYGTNERVAEDNDLEKQEMMRIKKEREMLESQKKMKVENTQEHDDQFINCLHVEWEGRLQKSEWKCPKCGSPPSDLGVLDGGSAVCSGEKCGTYFHHCALIEDYSTNPPIHPKNDDSRSN